MLTQLYFVYIVYRVVVVPFVFSCVLFLIQFDKYPTKVDPFYKHSVSFCIS